MWDLIPGDLFILVHNGLYRYVSRGTGYRGRWWLGVLITTAILLVIMAGLGWVLYHWVRLLRRLVRQQDAPIHAHRH